MDVWACSWLNIMQNIAFLFWKVWPFGLQHAYKINIHCFFLYYNQWKAGRGPENEGYLYKHTSECIDWWLHCLTVLGCWQPCITIVHFSHLLSVGSLACLLCIVSVWDSFQNIMYAKKGESLKRWPVHVALCNLPILPSVHKFFFYYRHTNACMYMYTTKRK